MGVYCRVYVMKIYLDGVEYKAYREIMESLDVRYGCLNYEYIWSRTPRFSLEEACEFLDEVLINPGNLLPMHVEEYVEYLNSHASIITVAIELYTEDRFMLDTECLVDIIPWHYNLTLTPRAAVANLSAPFVKQALKKLNEQGTKVHGVNCELPFFDSMNSGTWMRGTAGWISDFSRKNRIEMHTRDTSSAIARKLLLEGYNLDLNKIKRGDWKAIAKMNCASWKKYQDYMEDKCQ